jgi:hypothetical protein
MLDGFEAGPGALGEGNSPRKSPFPAVKVKPKGLRLEAMSKTSSTPAPQEIRDAVAAALSDRGGLRQAAESLGVSPHACERVLSGLGVRRGTVAAIKLALQERRAGGQGP